MSGPDTNFWIVISLVLKSKENTSTTQTVYITNRPAGVSDSATSHVFPILQEISGIEYEVGNDGMPVSASGSIVIKDAPGSIGTDRRFSDLLDRWAIIEQPVAVKIIKETTETAIELSDLLSLSGSPIEVYAGRVTSWSKRYDSEIEELSLEIESFGLTARPMNYPLPSTLTDDPSAIGRELPIVFGGASSDFALEYGIQVPAYSGGTIGAPNARYYYAFGLGDPSSASSFEYQTTTVNPYTAPHVRDPEGNYRDAWTGGGGWKPAAAIGTTILSAPGTEEYAVQVISGWEGVIIGARMAFDGLGSAVAPLGDITFRLYAASPGEYPDDSKLYATGVVPKSAYHASLSGSSNFMVDCRFDRPVPHAILSDFFPQQGQIWVSIQMDQYFAGTDFIPVTNGTVRRTAKRTAATNGGWLVTGTNGADVDLLYLTPSLGQTAADVEGRSAAYIEFAPETAPAHATNPDITKMDVIALTQGIKDNGSGHVTGTPNARITNPRDCIDLLLRSWDGSAWNHDGTATISFLLSGNYTTARTAYPRSVAGYLEGDVSNVDIIGQIVKEHALKISPSNTGLVLWAWGASQETQIVFTDDNCRIEDFEVDDKSTIVNDFNIRITPTLLFANAATQAGSRGRGAESEFSLQKSNSAGYTQLTAKSRALYGTNRNEDFQAFLLYKTTSAETLANYYIRAFDEPDAVVTLVTPVTDDSDVQPLEIVEIVSTLLPSYFGTSPNGKNPTYSSAKVQLFDSDPVRAKRYRAQIIAKTYQIGDEGVNIKYKARIVGSYHPNDPT